MVIRSSLKEVLNLGMLPALSTGNAHALLTAAAVTLVFAGFARLVRGVTWSGAAAGALVCFLLCAGAGPWAFAALVTVFLLAWTTTRFGGSRKQTLGLAEKPEGRKTSQVLANLSVAAACAALYGLDGLKPFYLLGMAAALSEAGADTVSSELGQACSKQARLITSWKAVPAGTDGGVTILGTAAGIAAACVVGLVCLAGGLVSWRGWVVASVSAILGMLADSFLGAGPQRWRWLNNDGVNFIGTLTAATLAVVLEAVSR